MAEKDIRFIRKKGRIIPIRISKKNRGFSRQKRTAIRTKKKKLLQSSALFSLSGIGASVLAGQQFGKAIKRAERISKATFRFAMEKSEFLPKRAKSIGGGFRLADKKLLTAKRATMTGQFIGGALLSQGVQRALRATGFESDSVALSAGSEIGSQIAAVLIARSAAKKLKIRAPRIKIPSSLKQKFKDLGSRFIKRQFRFKGI